MVNSEFEILIEKEFLPFLSDRNALGDVRVKVTCEKNEILTPQGCKRVFY